jgi:P pilus assembly chaperone PapD
MRLPQVSALALLIAFSGISAAAQPAPAPAAPVTAVGANLNLTPKRITLDKNRRSATVYIYNQGNAPATFDIALVDRVMTPEGQIVAVGDATAAQKPLVEALKSAKDILLVSPRRATLAPGQGQTIRLRIASVPQNPTGEFRSHLTVTTIPPPTAGLSAEQAAQGAPNALSFQITSVFGISIPAIVRFSDPDVRAAIQNAHIEYAQLSPDGVAPPKRTAIMVFDLARLGSSSLFGNLEVKSATQRSGAVLGLARGVGVYPEVQQRTVRLPLTRAPAAGEKLEITFTDDDTSPGKLLAKLDL